jgi:glycosidase
MLRSLFLTTVCLRLVLAAPPAIIKVEPPDWVAEPGGATLRMLVTGTDLAGTSIRAPFPTTSIRISQGGTHLFFDLQIPARVAPGRYPIKLTTATGTAEAPFSIVPTLSFTGRFQGISSDDVLYLIMPDRFANGDPSNDDPVVSRGLHDRSNARYYHGGDFQGILEHLDYLRDLGVTALWITPIYDNANQLGPRQAMTDYHGYGAVDFYAADEHFGDLAKFRELVDSAHARGIKIVLDQVANHTGPTHPWLKDPPTTTWFHGDATQHLANTWRTWTLISPHLTPPTQISTLDGWFAGILPDLNQNDPEVARYLIQNTLWWISRTGIDAIREDTLPYVPRWFWHDWTGAIRQRYPSFSVIGEVFDGDPALVSYFQAGQERDGVDTGVDSLFDFPLHYMIRKVFAEGSQLRTLPQMLAHDFLYPNASRLVTFFDLHDVPRFMNEPGATFDGLKRAFTFLLTARGIPLIYYGDEIGLPGGSDPDNRRDFPGGWKDDPHNAFVPSGRTPEQQMLFEHLRKLTHLRAEMSALRSGKMVDLLTEDDAWAFACVAPQGSVLVVFNNSKEPATLRIPLASSGIAKGARLEDWFGKAPPVIAADAIEVRLPSLSAAIYR